MYEQLDIAFRWSPWWLLVILPAVAGAVYVYYAGQQSFRLGQRRILAILRGLSLALLGFLLLQPLLEKKALLEEKPLLLWLEDHSRSILLRDSAASLDYYQNIAPRQRSALEENYRVYYYPFAENLGQPDSGITGQVTDISKALREVRGRHYGENIGAMVLATDGIYNRGRDPRYLRQGWSFPVYSLGLGDTTRYKDLKLGDLSYNPVVFQGNSFPLEIPVEAYNAQGATYRLSVRRSGEETPFYREDIAVRRQDHFFKTSLQVPAPEDGRLRLEVALSELVKEQNTTNNRQTIEVDVLDAELRIALLSSQYHPDLGALRKALESAQSYQVATYVDRPLPADTLYDLYLAYEPDEAQVDQIKTLQRPMLLIGGEVGSLQRISRLTQGTWKGEASPENVKALVNPDFALYSLNEKTREALQEWPPLQTNYGDYEGAEHTLLWQKVGAVETQKALLYFTRHRKKKAAVLSGTNFWRWRLQNYRQERSFSIFDEFWQKLVRYLTTEERRRRFVVDVAPKYGLGEKVKFQARLYNASYELSTESRVELRLSNQDGKLFNYEMNPGAKTYRLFIEDLPEGEYQWEASTELGGETFRARGQVSVKERLLEQRQTVARHGFLQNFSKSTRGKYLPLAQADQLPSELQQNPAAEVRLREEQQIDSLLQWGWLFFVLLAMLTAEWALRKYWGQY